MKKIERDQLANRIVQFYENIAQRDDKIVLHHFKVEGILTKTIRNILERYKQEGRITTSSPPGRKKSKKLKNIEKKIEKLLEKDPEVSARTASSKLGISKTYYNKIKLHRLKIRSFRKRIIPEATEEQQKRAKKSCRKIYRRLTEEKLVLVMGDETYVPEDPKLVPGPEFYHVKNKKDLPIERRVKKRKNLHQNF